MMKCKKCNGTGRLLEPFYDTTGLIANFKGDICFVCNGTGKIEQTNEEWIRSCSTEELVEWIKTVTRHCYACGYDMARNGIQTKPKCPFQDCVQDDTERWLKEKHK